MKHRTGKSAKLRTKAPLDWSTMGPKRASNRTGLGMTTSQAGGTCMEWILKIRCHRDSCTRCFFDLAKQELVFNNRSTAAPGTNKKPKLCGTSTPFMLWPSTRVHCVLILQGSRWCSCKLPTVNRNALFCLDMIPLCPVMLCLCTGYNRRQLRDG